FVFVAVAVALGWRTVSQRRLSPDASSAPGGAGGAAQAPSPATGPRTAITVVFGTEKDAWIQASVAEFRAANPGYDVELVSKGSLEAAQDILDGKLRPTVWSPADSLMLGILNADWRTKNGAPLFAADGDLAPQPLLLSPLVFVVWEDRAQALL